MGYRESSVERGKLDKCCNSPCEKWHYLEVGVVALYREPVEMNLKLHFVGKADKVSGWIEFYECLLCGLSAGA